MLVFFNYIKKDQNKKPLNDFLQSYKKECKFFFFHASIIVAIKNFIAFVKRVAYVVVLFCFLRSMRKSSSFFDTNILLFDIFGSLSIFFVNFQSSFQQYHIVLTCFWSWLLRNLLAFVLPIETSCNISPIFFKRFGYFFKWTWPP